MYLQTVVTHMDDRCGEALDERLEVAYESCRLTGLGSNNTTGETKDPNLLAKHTGLQAKGAGANGFEGGAPMVFSSAAIHPHKLQRVYD